MKRLCVTGAALVLVAVSGCRQQPAGSLVAGPKTLTSISVELPADDAQFPAGPHADVINLHCTACHSVNMVLTQPPLSADQWKAEVTKMRGAYKAQVPDAAMPDILAYLKAMSAEQAKARVTAR